MNQDTFFQKEEILKTIIDRNLSTPYALVEFLKLSKEDREIVYEQWARHCAGTEPL